MFAVSLKHPSAEMRGQTEAEFLANAPILGTLKARLEASRTPREWAIAKAQQALYLARTDRIDEAVPVPQEIRTQFRGNEEPEVYYWLWLLEAVLDFYRTGATKGMQQIQRAMLMAKSLKRTDLEEYLAAWAAHFCFTDGKYAEMVRWLKLSRLHEAALPEAACRASLIAAVAWQTCDEDKPASMWFGRARDIARSIGDRATIMASIENRALVRLDRLWFSLHTSKPSSERLMLVEHELLGGLAYERITGSGAFESQGVIARIRLLVLKGEFSSALVLVNSSSSHLEDLGFSIVRATQVLRLWLQTELDPCVSFTQSDLVTLAAQVKTLDYDDASVCWKILANLANRIALLEFGRDCEALASQNHDRHSKELLRLHNAINSELELK